MTKESSPDPDKSNRPQPEDTSWNPALFETFFRAIHSPKDEAAYYAQRHADRQTGLPTWVVDDLHDPAGRMYKFYDGGNLYGFIQENFELESVRPFVYGDDGSPIEIEGDFVSLGDAVLAIKKHHASHDN